MVCEIERAVRDGLPGFAASLNRASCCIPPKARCRSQREMIRGTTLFEGPARVSR
jgi:hypothetical protein